MKKFLILVAIIATTSTLCWAKPTHNSNLIRLENFEAKAKVLNNTAYVLDNFSLPAKSGETFQDDSYTEIIAHDILNGQVFEMGPNGAYNITYEPISKTIFTISAARYRNKNTADYDSVVRIGEIMAIPYVKGQVLDTNTFIYKRVWRETYPLTPASVRAFEYYNASIVVGNPTGTTDITQLKFSVAAQREEIPAFSNSANPIGTYIVLGTTANILDNSSYENLDIVNTEIREPRLNWVGAYPTNQILKGHIAYFNGTPYSLYFGRVFNSANEDDNLLKYAVISVNMNNPNNDIDDAIEKVQFLPSSIEDIFGYYALTPANDKNNNVSNLANEMNLDYDNNNNIYLAFNTVTAATHNDIDLSGGYTNLPTPVVVKIPYDPTYDAELVNTSATVDSMPYQTIIDYINSEGGLWDVKDGSVVPRFVITWDKHTNEIPFIVAAEDNYSFLAEILYFVNNDGDASAKLVEINKSNGKWSIRNIHDITSTWLAQYGGIAPDAESKTAQYYANDVAALHDYGIFNVHVDTSVISFVGYTDISRRDQQISRTADGQYLIAKWKETDRTKYTKKLSSPVTFRVLPQIVWNNSSTGNFMVTTDSLFCSQVFLSYRHINSDKWSEPINAGDLIHDSISFRGTFMPRVVPSVDEVLISYAYGVTQVPKQVGQPLMMQRNWATYQQASLICPSARSGPQKFLSIKEEGPATANNLDAYPNPAATVTNFRFSLLQAGHTKLTVMNALGQEIDVVVDEFCNASDYSLNYNVSKLPVGVYYFTLTSGAFVQTKAFTVVR